MLVYLVSICRTAMSLFLLVLTVMENNEYNIYESYVHMILLHLWLQ